MPVPTLPQLADWGNFYVIIGSAAAGLTGLMFVVITLGAEAQTVGNENGLRAFVTPTLVGAEEYDFAERDLRYTRAMFELLTADREFADHNKTLLNGWLTDWVPRALQAARKMQPLWSQPDQKPPRFEDSLDATKNRFAGIVTDLHLDVPKELAQ